MFPAAGQGRGILRKLKAGIIPIALTVVDRITQTEQICWQPAENSSQRSWQNTRRKSVNPIHTNHLQHRATP